jgi:hypothetical protein
LLAEDPGSNFLMKYLLLEYFPERFVTNEGVNIYYNKYYWYMKFYQAYKKTHGSDAGMEQQEFKIIEESEMYDIDYNIMEELMNEFQ